MSLTYSQPPGRTRQQRDRNPRQQQQWKQQRNSEEQDMDTTGASGYSHHSAASQYSNPRHSPVLPHEPTSQHDRESPRQSLQPHGSYYVKAPNAVKCTAVAKVMHEEEAEYSAYQAKKRAQLSDTLSQISPTKLGGRKLDDSDIATMREQQEREQRLAAKFESIRKREKREQCVAEQKQRENQMYEAKKQKARQQAVRLEEKKRVESEAQRDEIRRARLRYYDKMK